MSGAAGVSAGGAAGSVAVAAGARSQNGEVDYKKVRNFDKKEWGNCSALLLNMFRFSQLWEESQKENNRLRDELGKLKDDLGATKRKLDTAIHVRRYFPFLFFFFTRASELERKLSNPIWERRGREVSNALSRRQNSIPF